MIHRNILKKISDMIHSNKSLIRGSSTTHTEPTLFPNRRKVQDGERLSRRQQDTFVRFKFKIYLPPSCSG